MNRLQRSTFLLGIIFILLFSIPVTGRSRQRSIENFIDSLRLNEDGYANSPDGEVNITATTQVLEIANVINYDINNSLDILLFFQNCQNSSGGFSQKPNSEENWDSTIHAVRGLQYLDVNQSQIQNWEIFNYLNRTAIYSLYDISNIGNSTIYSPYNLSLGLINIYFDYLLTSFYLGFSPFVEFNWLENQLQSFQMSNGSYSTFESAVTSIHLLSLLELAPRDIDLASKFLLAYIQNNGAFSNEQGGVVSLYNTYLGVRALFELQAVQKIEYLDEMLIFILELQKTNSGFGEVGSMIASVQDTWYAIKTLYMLGSLNELESPDVLQTVGFLKMQFPYLVIISITFVRRFRK